MMDAFVIVMCITVIVTIISFYIGVFGFVAQRKTRVQLSEKMKPLLPRDCDQRYEKQAALITIQRVLQWVTFFLHDAPTKHEALCLMNAATALANCQKEVIIDIFVEACDHATGAPV